jgi:hypothetical protein
MLLLEQGPQCGQAGIPFLLAAITLSLVEIGSTLTTEASAVGSAQGVKRETQQDVLPQRGCEIYPPPAQDGKHGVLIFVHALGVASELIRQVNGQIAGKGIQTASAQGLDLRDDIASDEESVVGAQQFDLSPEKGDIDIITKLPFSLLELNDENRSCGLVQEVVHIQTQCAGIQGPTSISSTHPPSSSDQMRGARRLIHRTSSS